MKVARFITINRRRAVGALYSQEEIFANLIDGCIFDANWVETPEIAEVDEFLAPVKPPNIIAIEVNYVDYAREAGLEIPEKPVIFFKGTNSMIGHKGPIILPHIASNEVDYGGALGVIIKKTTKNVQREHALDYVLGYCCANDITARNMQFNDPQKQWARSKSFDTFCPLGPYLVTPDEIPNPNQLEIRTQINGTLVQKVNTADMIFDVPTLISHLSQSMALLPGTIILTGTPKGVGYTRKPPVFLRNYDTVTVSIEKIGYLTNTVRTEGSVSLNYY